MSDDLIGSDGYGGPIDKSNQYVDLYNDSVGVDGGKQDNINQLDKYEAITYEHPDFQANIGKWRKYQDCYNAEDIYRFLHKHPRESQDMFETRLKRGYFYNYCASVVDLIVAYLFHSPIERDPGSSLEIFAEIYQNADNCGSTYSNFMQEVASKAQICGHCGVLVDAPRVEGIRSEADRKREKVRPYLTIVEATQIRDWVLDKYGNFEWVKIEIQRDADRDPFHVTETDIRYFQIWYKDRWEEWKVDDRNEIASQVAGDRHSLGQVPLVMFYNERAKNHRWFGLSMLRDIADINIAILNWSSLGDEEIAERCLNILTMEDSGDAGAAILSHHNVLNYAPGSKPPEYLVPGDTPLKLIADWIERAKDEIYRLSKLSGSTGLLGVREATSGIAYAYEFNETNQSLSKKAEGMEQGEIEVHQLIAKWIGSGWDGYVAYPREFGVDDFNLELSILADSRTNLTSETAIKSLEKKIASKMFARDSMELRTKIKQEIEAADAKAVGFVESFGSLPQGLQNPGKEDDDIVPAE
jgi:hypothetical protein